LADDKGSSSGSTAADLGQVIAPLTAVVAVLVSLAAAGVISNAQRNHGDDLLLGFGLIIGAAALWLVALVLPAPEETPPSPPQDEIVEGQTPYGNFTLTHRTVPPPAPPTPTGLKKIWADVKPYLWGFGRFLRVFLRILAVVPLVIGIVIATNAIIDTQSDSQRPAVSATFDSGKGVLDANVSAEGLKTDQRMSIRVDALRQSKTIAANVEAIDINKPLYLALLGPDGSGKVTYKFSVYVPPSYNIVGLEAWTAQDRPKCFDVASRNQSAEAGCAIIRLKPRSVTPTKKKRAKPTKRRAQKPSRQK
jgi:hypothetical protein